MNEALALSGQLPSGRDVHVIIEPRLLGLEVAGLVFGLSADQLAKMQDHDGFPCVRIGRRRLVPVAAADAWFAKHTGTAP